MAKRKLKAKTVGRPSKFDERYLVEAEKLAMLGLTDAQMADFWDISVPTFYAWQKKEPAFLKALKAGKVIADGMVAQSLYRRATGYDHEAVKIFMPGGTSEPVYAPYTERYPPDATSAIFWLKNRRPDLWRDKSEVIAKTQTVDQDEQPVTTLQLAREIVFAVHLGMLEAAKAPPSIPDTPLKH